MATLAMIKYYIEGNDLMAKIQQDGTDIQNADLSVIQNGWNDLTFDIQHDPEFTDIMNLPYATAGTVLQNVTNDAKSYLQSITLTVEDYDNSGYVNLEDGNGNPATLFDFVTAEGGNYSVSYEYDWENEDSSPNVSANWGPVMQKVETDQKVHNIPIGHGDVYTYGEDYYKATGTGNQWNAFVQRNGGDASQLNHDLGKV